MKGNFAVLIGIMVLSMLCFAEKEVVTWGESCAPKKYIGKPNEYAAAKIMAETLALAKAKKSYNPQLLNLRRLEVTPSKEQFVSGGKVKVTLRLSVKTVPKEIEATEFLYKKSLEEIKQKQIGWAYEKGSLYLSFPEAKILKEKVLFFNVQVRSIKGEISVVFSTVENDKKDYLKFEVSCKDTPEEVIINTKTEKTVMKFHFFLLDEEL